MALRSLVGDDGELTVTLRDGEAAESLANQDWPQVRVLAHVRSTAAETFGAFRLAMLVAVAAGPLLSSRTTTVTLVRRNLRPGGRFVVDLPAREMVPDLHAAWRQPRMG